MRIEYHPSIEQELREAASYYNKVSSGLGSDFLAEFERQISTIAALPLRWRAVENGIRRAMMRRFPYAIYFRVVDDDLIRVIVIKHRHRHPERGLDRR